MTSRNSVLGARLRIRKRVLFAFIGGLPCSSC